MDFTQVQPGHSRKSFDRRVSWAQHTVLHYFEKARKSGSSSAQSSPQVQNDENTQPQSQPQRRVSARPRFSVAFSENGERSMELDEDDEEAVELPAEFLDQFQNSGGAEDDEFTDEEEDDEDMEVTEAIRLNIERKRSLSLGGRMSLPGRRMSSIPGPLTSSQSHSENQIPSQHLQSSSLYPSLAEVEEITGEHEDDLTGQSASFLSETSAEGAAMDFIVPIDFPLGQPEPPSDVWHQLRAMTHAGANADEPQSSDLDEVAGFLEQQYVNVDGATDEELTDAMSRLQQARNSGNWLPDALQGQQDDSFASTEDSFAGEDADQTVNMTMTRLVDTNFAGMDSAIESTMDMSQVYEEAQAGVQQALLAHQPSLFDVSPLADRVSNLSVHSSPMRPPPPATVPVPFTFTAPRPRPSTTASPAKPPTPHKGPVFAPPKSPQPHRGPVFAPPKSPQPHRGTAAFAPPIIPKSPKRAAATELPQGTAGPSPAKKQAVGRSETASSSAANPLQDTTENRRGSSVRRPPGYFAQRRSLGANLQGSTSATAAASPRKLSVPSAPATISNLSNRRATVSASSSGHSLYPNVEQIAREDPPTPSQPPPPTFVRSTLARSPFAPPSPTRESPQPQVAHKELLTAPASNRQSVSPAPPITAAAASEQEQDEDELDIESEQAMTSSMPTSAQQWREGVVDGGEMEDEGVRIVRIILKLLVANNYLSSHRSRSNSSSR